MELEQRALDTLRACETSHGTVAGRRHFHQTWIRDACFAAWGHLALGEHEKVEPLIALFSEHVSEEGRMPLRFGDPDIMWPAISDALSGATRFVEDDPRLDPRWGDDKRDAIIVDSNPLYVLTAGLLALSKGAEPSEQRLAAMERAFAYTETLCRFGLVWQEPYGDWCDSVKRRGYVTYTNALHYGAARVLAILKGEEYAKRADEIRALMNERLWTSSRYAEWADEYGTMRNFSVESNMLCTLLGVSDAKRTELVFSSFDRIDELFTRIGRRVSPRYPNEMISARMRIVGMGDYHDRMQWLWTSGLALLASRLTAPDHEREERIIRALDELTSGDAWISEVYLNDEPFSNVVYTSEEPFAWSAGMLLAGLIENDELATAFGRIRT